MPAQNIILEAKYGKFANEWILVDDANELVAGDQIVIVAKNYNMGLSTTQNTNNRSGVSVEKVGNTVLFGDAIAVITLEAGKSAGTFGFKTNAGYLYAASSSSNHLKSQNTIDANASWKITIVDGVATIVAQGSNTRNVMQYNPNNGSPLFSCYAPNSQQALTIYKANSYYTIVDFVEVEYYDYDGTYISSQEFVKGEYATINNGSDLTREGYQFIGWASAANAEEAQYQNPWQYAFDENTKLYAIWSEEFELSFNSNGGEGEIESLIGINGSKVKLPDQEDMIAPNNHVFVGWNTLENGEGTSYNPGDDFTITEDIVLYAIWEELSTVNIWALVENVNALKLGDQIVIVANGYDYALSTTQKTNNRGQAAISKEDKYILIGSDVQEITLEAGSVDGTFAFSTELGYLYAASSSDNYLKSQNTINANASWKITIVDGVATIVAQGSNSRNVLQYNQTSSLFSCYGSASQKAISIYRLVENSVENCVHTYESITTPATCTEDGNIVYVCHDCMHVTTSTIDALGHTFENGTCIRCPEQDPSYAPPHTHIECPVCGKCTDEDCTGSDGEKCAGHASEPTVLATFEFGANGTATHADGSNLGASKTYTEGKYTLNLVGMSKVYGPARDAKGNSCIKLGTSDVVGTFSFTVDENVTQVVINVAKYKANTSKINVNGTNYTLSGASNDGQYDEIVIDTTTNKTVTFKTVSGGVRCMINNIIYYGYK